MKNWSLSKKMSVVLLVLIIGTVTTAVFSIDRLREVAGVVKRLSEHNVPKVALSSRINRNISEIKNETRAHVMVSNPADFKGIEARIDELAADITKSATELEAIAIPEEVEALKHIRQKLTKWEEIQARLETLSAAMKNDEAERVAREESFPMLESLTKEAGELRQGAIDRTKARATATAELLDSANFFVILISSIFSVVGLFLAWLVLRAVAQVNEAVDQIVSELRDSSSQVGSAAQQVSAASQELSQASTEQAASLEETAASIEQMNSMIKKNSENSTSAAQTSVASHESAGRGQKVVARMIESMSEIDKANSAIMSEVEDSNRQISDIVKVIGEIGNKTKVINDIVFQTKLLSFNASVEAARAGEHGKGFAVVAEEVGNLAQMSGNAAKEISTMLEGSIQKVEGIVTQTKTRVERFIAEGKAKVEGGTQVANECATVLNEIVENVGKVARMAGEISQASSEQSSGIAEITRAMSQLDQVTQQNAATSEQAASAAEQLTAQAASVAQVVETLQRTMKGSSESPSAAVAPKIAKPRAEKPKVEKAPAESQAKVLHLKSKKPTESALAAPEGVKKVANGGETPSFDDPRFKDV